MKECGIRDQNVVLETHTQSLFFGYHSEWFCNPPVHVFLLGVLSELFQVSAEVSCCAYVKSPVL